MSGLFGKSAGVSPGSIFGANSTLGQVTNGIFGSLLDPGNITGLFGKNVGPGAFMDPNGSGGGLFPGQSLGQQGVLGINPEGSVGINPSSANSIGAGINDIGGGIAGGEAAGGLGGLGGFLSGDTGAVGSGTAALPSAASGSASSIAPAYPWEDASATLVPSALPAASQVAAQTTPSSAGGTNPASPSTANQWIGAGQVGSAFLKYLSDRGPVSYRYGYAEPTRTNPGQQLGQIPFVGAPTITPPSITG